MEQHPIPQQISSYQFKLVGDMTLKQFFQLAGGLLVGLILYSSPLIGIVKWPLAIFSAILGIALAFMPLEGRPLERWIFAFFKAIYTPTIFFWKKTTTIPKFFQDETSGTTLSLANPSQDVALKNYLSVSKQASAPLSKLEGAEQGFLSSLSGIFAGLTQTPTPASQTAAPLPQNTTGIKRTVEIPQSTPIRVTAQTPHLVVEEKPKVVTPSYQVSTQQVSPVIAGEKMISTRQAIFSIDAAPPNPPTSPNIVVGQVVDEGRKIVEGAIMEIRDEAGRPIRALRSNKLGHFVIVTPLDNGRYDIATEKDGYQFTPVSFNATGAIIPPILVEGRRIAVVQGIPVQIVNPNQFATQPVSQY